VPTYRPIYHLFLDLEKQAVCLRIQEFFSIPSPSIPDLSDWQGLLMRLARAGRAVKIGLVAKYVGSNDPYISVIEAIKSASYACDVRVEVIVLDAEKLEQNDVVSWEQLKNLNGIVGPGGFDVRGTEGKIEVVRWARENKVPYFGLCLGLQVMLIEFGRSLVGMKESSSTEFDKSTRFPVISMLSEQHAVTQKGASMRLGEQACTVIPGTIAYKAYGQDVVKERHRHRYEFNNTYRKDFEDKGIVFSGINQDQDLIEIAELKGHPFMLGVQFHPEFLSTPLKPHPLFLFFMKAVLECMSV
jgi:CTP synthase